MADNQNHWPYYGYCRHNRSIEDCMRCMGDELDRIVQSPHRLSTPSPQAQRHDARYPQIELYRQRFGYQNFAPHHQYGFVEQPLHPTYQHPHSQSLMSPSVPIHVPHTQYEKPSDGQYRELSR
ncbi:hypothetical protein EX30DRAFT_342511 [Ascodesmis nigricans]|uniref:Uncharacterized protein n=1 Tax=Ascodesmis nigricans TaxID=341454 RepID=A0A4S2MPU0_9PEZI|nr:hypothetical protein EX30DRAFT_342511 [Ascodesmis nigricans]